MTWDLFQNYMGWVEMDGVKMGGGRDETRLTGGDSCQSRWQGQCSSHYSNTFVYAWNFPSHTHTHILMREEGYIHKWNRFVVIRYYDVPINALIFTELNDSIFKNRIQKSGYNLSEIFNILFTITSKFLESEDHSSFALLVYVT